MNVPICAIGCHLHPERTWEIKQIVTFTAREGADALEFTQTANTWIEYSVGIIRLGNIVSLALEEEATPDLVNTGDGDLDNKAFIDLGVSDPTVNTLEDQGTVHPFPTQAFTPSPALERYDIIGQVKAGTGKTLSSTIPILEDVIAPDEDDYEELLNPDHLQASTILPTRKPAKQIATGLCGVAKYLPTRIVDIYGGVALESQIGALKRSADIVVGTPGHLIGLLRKGILHLSGAETIVLDEVDETLDLGFLPNIETLLPRVPSYRHTILFSTAMPGPVVALVRRFMEYPTHIRIQDPEGQNQAVDSVKQIIYRVHAVNKIEVVVRILQSEGRGRSVIFYRAKCTIAHLDEGLSACDFAMGSPHGDLSQDAYKQALQALRKGKTGVLIVTDVAAYGIDVDNVTHVISYQCPEDEKAYIHRIRRTGHTGNSGIAVIFAGQGGTSRWSLISKALDPGVPEPLETYHTSAYLFTGLDIPEDTAGRLPRAERTTAEFNAEKLEDLGGPSSRSQGCRPGDRGVVTDKGSHRRHCGERNRKARDGDHEARTGQHGRSDRGTQGRGRGNRSQARIETIPQAPCRRIHRRKSQASE